MSKVNYIVSVDPGGSGVLTFYKNTDNIFSYLGCLRLKKFLNKNELKLVSLKESIESLIGISEYSDAKVEIVIEIPNKYAHISGKRILSVKSLATQFEHIGMIKVFLQFYFKENTLHEVNPLVWTEYIKSMCYEILGREFTCNEKKISLCYCSNFIDIELRASDRANAKHDDNLADSICIAMYHMNNRNYQNDLFKLK
jgi:hypothetical protein